MKADPAVRTLLSRNDLRFAEAEVERLRRLGEERLPDEPATRAIHGDLWLQNVLATGTEWTLLDWDSVRIGDPAGEYASLLHGPTGRELDASVLLRPDGDLRDRFDLLLRAYCFDEIVDPVSDLTMTPAGLADHDRTWRARTRRSEVALTRYRGTYL